MPTFRFTKDNWPTPEEYRRLLRETMFTENPIDDLLELADELKEYERRYHMSSEDFWARFQRGELGDDMDFIGWAGAYDLFRKRKSRLEAALIQTAIWQATLFETAEAVAT